MTTASSAHTTTTGGTGRPKVSLSTDTAVAVQAGGVPVTEPLTHPLSTPSSSAPMPRVTTRASTLNR